MYNLKNKNNETESIKSSETYYIGFAHFVREMCIKEIQGDFDAYKETSRIITTCKILPEEDNLDDWFESNQYRFYEFNEGFVKGVILDIMRSIHEGITEVYFVSGYFPFANCKMKGDEILKELD